MVTTRSSRRRFLRRGAAVVVAGLAGCNGGPSGNGAQNGGANPTTPENPGGGSTGGDGTLPRGTATTNRGTLDGATGLPVGLRTVADGFSSPVGFEVPLDDGDFQYIVDQGGQIYIRGPDGVLDEPFLDISDRIFSGGEMGLLGLAFHPEFASTRRLYVRYSAPNREGTPSNYNHTFVLSEFRATDDGTRAIMDSERTLLEIPEPQSNHNAGAIAFGPDGYLYVGVGDGGAGNDVGQGHVDDWYAKTAGGNGQDVTQNLLGSILRIDVDTRDGDNPYGIPDDNPLVGTDGLDEHYAWGFRNPWRMSFDGNDLFVGDVGQNRFEEVDIVEKGGNYGWNVKEGRHCFNADTCPDETPDGEPLRDPIIEYPHRADEGPDGISVIGGYVYRQSAIPALRGKYVFGDYRANGRLFVASRPDDRRAAWPVDVLEVAQNDRQKLDLLLSFGRDRNGELYALTTSRGSGGAVHKLVPSES